MPNPPGYGWNAASGRYTDLSTGHFVSFREMRTAVDGVIEASAGRTNALTTSLTEGRISLATWQEGMAAEIKLSHVMQVAAARGGTAQVTAAEWGRSGPIIKAQLGYLQHFANQIADGTAPLDGRLVQRAMLYSDAARGTYEETRRRVAESVGHTEERRVLDSDNPCEGCQSQADQGWQPLGTLDSIGDEECGARCHCSFETRIGED